MDSPQPLAGTCYIYRFPISICFPNRELVYTGSRFPKSGTCIYDRLPIWEIFGNREPVYTTGSRGWLGRILNRLTYLIVVIIPFLIVWVYDYVIVQARRENKQNVAATARSPPLMPEIALATVAM